MHEQLIVPSSPEQAQRIMRELGALLLREPGEIKPDSFGFTVFPDVPRALLPSCVLNRHVIPDFDLQVPSYNSQSISPYHEPEAAGTDIEPMAGIGIGQEVSTPYVDSLSSVNYRVIRHTNVLTEATELNLQVATTFDAVEHNPEDHPLRDSQDFMRTMAENPFAAEREMDALLSPDTIGDMAVNAEQKHLLEPAAVPYQEAEELIKFISNLYR